MKIKNILLVCAACVLSAVIAIGGTLAYLTYSDHDINTMVIGDVKIEQIEKQRVDMSWQDQNNPAELKDFVQGKKLLPAVNTTGGAANNPQVWAPGGAPGALEEHYVNWGDFVTADVAEGSSAWNGIWGTSLKNVQDKFVFVKNTGDNDVYYRTIILYEYDETEKKNSYNQGMLHFNVNGNERFVWTDSEDGLPETVTVNGEVYGVMVATYQLPLKPGTVSRPSLLQVGLDGDADGEVVRQFGDTYDMLVLSQAVQAEGFDTAEFALTSGFGEITVANLQKWFGAMEIPSLVYNADELQDALDNAKNGDTIVLGADIEGDISVTQKPDVKITLDGNGKTLDGTVTVKGQSANLSSTAFTIKNMKFVADTVDTEACVNMGVLGNTNTRYIYNLTVENCYFNVPGKAAVKSYDNGDKNLKIIGCTVANGMHSLLQVTNVADGLLIQDCKVYSKNGINTNYSEEVTISGCEIDVTGYAVRFGVNGSTNNGNFTIANSTLKSANGDGDAVIILRGTMSGATLNLKGTTLTGTPEITGTANIVK